MSRSFINLRRVLFGVSCAIVFGFGATQAFAYPGLGVYCPNPWGQPYYSYECGSRCSGTGYCGEDERCYCGFIP
jgi:hypothetical protein